MQSSFAESTGVGDDDESDNEEEAPAAPVEEEADKGDEIPPQPSGLGQLLNIFSSGTPKPKPESAPTALCCAAKRST